MLVAIVRMWVMPLPSSFWVDEMGTIFVVEHGANDPSFAVAPQVPQSVYYWLPAISRRLPGPREIVCRLPSLAAMAAALWIIARLAARLFHPEAGWLAAFACFSLRGISYEAADARPYALGTLVAVAALWFLVRWLDDGLWRDAVAFGACAALLWRVQLIFWPFYLVFGIYIIVRIAQGETPVTWSRAALVVLAVTLALAPVALRALALFREAREHVVIALPTQRDLVLSLKLGLVAIYGAIAGILAIAFRWKTSPLPASTYILIAAWWLCQPLGLFAFSYLSGDSVFVSRYLLLSLPGAVLFGVALAAIFIPAGYWKPLAALAAILIVVRMGDWRHTWPPHHNSDWRSAAETVRREATDSDTPVICPSPFIEARPPAWRPDYHLPGFLYAHLAVYPLRGKQYLFPFETSPEAEQYANELMNTVFPRSHRFLIYGGGGPVQFWRDWFESRPALAGWTVRRLGPFLDVDLVEFSLNGATRINSSQSRRE
jgi:hypothetical protein